VDRIVVHGGKRLQGSVCVSGAKNSALAIMAATLLASGKHRLANVPDLRDIRTMRRLLEYFGAVTGGADSLDIDTRSIASVDAPYDLVRTMRASFLVLGPLLARYGKARVSLPGGCAIGVRPVDMHIKALVSLGASVTIEAGYVHAECGSLKGGTVVFDMPTVGGTENTMMAAALADGVTTIENAAREPEIVDLACALRSMGARIEGDGTSCVTIEGVRELQPLRYTVMPDRIEAGTLMAAAAITGGDIRIKNCPVAAMGAMIEKLRDTGLMVDAGVEDISVRGNGDILPVEITTNPFPGFPTDMQAQVMALLTLARGTSILRETIFENRFIHVAELDRMGAHIKVERDTAIVVGTDKLQGAAVMASDLRASASLILAGLAAQGTTVVSRVYHLDRGYEQLDLKLQQLGAEIYREPGGER
jgi:UDP-N-acetylglucosamine 1-carboxyvinyltransferase